MKYSTSSINKKFKCPICSMAYLNEKTLENHFETQHKDYIKKNKTTRQTIYDIKHNIKEPPKCIVCKRPNPWNENSGKYSRYCGRKECKEELRRRAVENMKKKYGKDTLLNDPEMQKKMLQNRSISGTYKFKDGTVINYTGSYELHFLKFIDESEVINPKDIDQCPYVFEYVYKGKKHFYLPDFYLNNFNLIIEIKDGGDNPNNHHKIQSVDKVKEKLKDQAIIDSKQYNYIKIVNKDYSMFLNLIKTLQDRSINDGDTGEYIIIIPQ